MYDPVPAEPSEEIEGYQAQCMGCEWASVLHLHEKQAAEDAEIHSNAYGHSGLIVTCETVDQIRVVGRD